MRYRCSVCESEFDLDADQAARCPKCLRKSTVRDASAPAASTGAGRSPHGPVPSARRVVVSTLAATFAVVALAMSWLALGQLLLLVGSTTVQGEILDAHLVHTRVSTCGVRYRYVVEGVPHEGNASTALPCPEGTLSVRVSTLDPDTSDLGPGLGLLALLVAPLTIFVAWAASIVALQLWMPDSQRLRRLAARIGSRYAGGAGSDG